MRLHGQSEPLMYLDFDGTLHPNCCRWGANGPYLDVAGEHKLFEHARLLENILREYPTVRLVLNSLWTEKLGVNGALDAEREGWPEWAMEHVVQTNPADGIGCVVVQGALHSRLLRISGKASRDSTRTH